MGPGWPAEIEFRTDTPTGKLSARRAYCVGMAGSGMQALAEWLVEAGWHVTGSDRSATPDLISRFQRMGARLSRSHDAAQLSPQPDWLIYSPAVPPHNPERAAAREQGVRESSYPQALGELMHSRQGISIAGTHGKSTTTALVGYLLRQAGLDPSILCGARMRNYDRSGVYGRGELFVAESCEYRGHFLDLHPSCIGLLGVEADHFDCFPCLDDAVAVYRAFVERLSPTDLLVANFDCHVSREIASRSGTRVVSVSTTQETADYLVTKVCTSPQGMQLSVRLPDSQVVELQCPLTGNHHAVNLTTALAIAREHGASLASCVDSIASFEGIHRRFEMRSGAQGMTWVDDYAHHPTALRAVIDAARDRFPGRRICCVFQPHQVSRTRELADDFGKALSRADQVLVLPVFGAREAADRERIDLASQLVRDVSDRGVDASFVADLDHTRATLETHLRPGDVVLTVGAGDIDRIYHEFTGRLRRHYAS